MNIHSVLTLAKRCSFQPDISRWFVPRKVGWGWDLNMGKVAAATRLLPSDGCVTDVDGTISPACASVLTWLPVAGCGALAVVGHFVGMRSVKLPMHWDIRARPDSFVSARPAAAIPVLLPALELASLLYGVKKDGGVHVAAAARTVGIEALSAFLLASLARYKETEEPVSDPLVIAGIVAVPVVAFGVFVAAARNACWNARATVM